MNDAVYRFRKAAIEAIIAKACEMHDLLPEAHFHSVRAVYFTAKGMEALALSATLETPNK